ncbi:hypothetical protein [Burkholderia diffusa]|uniref:hypothetical protein n=1 Tax=Burkholderia diffusa TaxID=488732 RepID=UPI000AFB7529|nr:hypothetical protein [Burkholderia diffusa]
MRKSMEQLKHANRMKRLEEMSVKTGLSKRQLLLEARATGHRSLDAQQLGLTLDEYDRLGLEIAIDETRQELSSIETIKSRYIDRATQSDIERLSPEGSEFICDVLWRHESGEQVISSEDARRLANFLAYEDLCEQENAIRSEMQSNEEIAAQTSSAQKRQKGRPFKLVEDIKTREMESHASWFFTEWLFKKGQNSGAKNWTELVAMLPTDMIGVSSTKDRPGEYLSEANSGWRKIPPNYRLKIIQGALKSGLVRHADVVALCQCCRRAVGGNKKNFAGTEIKYWDEYQIRSISFPPLDEFLHDPGQHPHWSSDPDLKNLALRFHQTCWSREYKVEIARRLERDGRPPPSPPTSQVLEEGVRMVSEVIENDELDSHKPGYVAHTTRGFIERYWVYQWDGCDTVVEDRTLDE